MLITQGSERDDRLDRQLASCLAGVAGALNAAAFYAVGFFSANMTGNVSTMSDHMATEEWLSAFFYMGIVLSFILGATFSATLIIIGRRHAVHGIYAYIILLEALLLALLGLSDFLILPSGSRTTLLVLGLAFLMGLQNAAVTRISDARVRTTHVSGMATDLGIELAVAADALLGNWSAPEAALNRQKLKLHLYTILSFMAGGIFGVVFYKAFGGYLWMTAAAFLLAVSLVGLYRARKRNAR